MKSDTLSLKQRAEEFLNRYPETFAETSSTYIKQLIEDLHIHQIELEIQNEELLRAQLELEASRNKYSDLYDFSPVGYVTISEKGIILQANLACTDMQGVERSSLIKTPFSRFIQNEDQDAFYFHCNMLFKEQAKQSCGLNLVRQDGSRFFAQLESILVNDPKIDTPQIRTSIININKRKVAEKALKEKDDQLRIAVEAAQLGTWIRNLITGEAIWNPFLYNLLGRDPNGPPIDEETFFTYIHPDDIERVRRHVVETLEKKKDFFDEFRIVREDKEVRWLAAASRVYRDKNGQPVRMAGVNFDITERKRADEALQESEKIARIRLAEIESIYDNAPVGLGVLDTDLRFIRVNKRLAEINGVTPEEHNGRTFRDIVPGFADKAESTMHRVMEAGEPVSGVEITGETTGNPGVIRTWIGNFLPLKQADGTVFELSIVAQDISQRKRDEMELQSAHDGLEAKVKERTARLVEINEELKAKNEEHRATAENLKDALVEIKALQSRLEAERAYLQEEIKSEYNYENIVGNSKALKHTLYRVGQIASTDIAVVILGETGTGKELIARAIHGAGSRKNRSLVKVNCAALPSNLMESELFGHEKGAFSDAVEKRLGRFEVADGATLFLDEIGELSTDLQAKLLRVLQDGEFERVGSSYTVKVDVRIIAATNRDLEEEVKKGRFREDLWYRLSVFPITAPPLRSRKEDIPLIVQFFVDEISKRLGKSIDFIPKSAMDALQNYHWPGNIRELKNVIERAVINSSENKLRLMDNLEKSLKHVTAPLQTMEQVEHDHIVRVLEKTRWKVAGNNGAANILGLNPSTLHGRMRKLGIRRPKRSDF